MKAWEPDQGEANYYRFSPDEMNAYYEGRDGPDFVKGLLSTEDMARFGASVGMPHMVVIVNDLNELQKATQAIVFAEERRPLQRWSVVGNDGDGKYALLFTDSNDAVYAQMVIP